MKIEQAIQQRKPFRNQFQRAMVNLIYTNNWVQDRIKAHLRNYNITLQQYNVLRILRGAGRPITTSIIRERLLDKMADTSRMVERLYQKGLVIKTGCQKDKRLVDVSLSEKGEALLAELDDQTHELDCILSRLSEEEARQLSDLLDKIRQEDV